MKAMAFFLLHIISPSLLCNCHNWKAIFVDTSDFFCYLLFYNPYKPDQWRIRTMYMADDNTTLQNTIYKNSSGSTRYQGHGLTIHLRMQHKESGIWIYPDICTRLKEIFVIKERDNDTNISIISNHFDLLKFNPSNPEHNLYGYLFAEYILKEDDFFNTEKKRSKYFLKLVEQAENEMTADKHFQRVKTLQENFGNKLEAELSSSRQ